MSNPIAIENPKIFVLPMTAANNEVKQMRASIDKAWKTIAPLWPLKSFIACNPLQGLEDLPFEAALVQAAQYFQQPDLPEPMANVNRETIKWCQAFFDEGQAVWGMPDREKGLYQAWRGLAVFDSRWEQQKDVKKWLNELPDNPEEAIAVSLSYLKIPPQLQGVFLRAMLTSLSGWAGYVKYRVQWAPSDAACPYPVDLDDYLAMRLAMTALLWPTAVEFLSVLEEQPLNYDLLGDVLSEMNTAELSYRLPLLRSLQASAVSLEHESKKALPDAQLVFCIDVRSEPFRRALESQGNYETFGFAGFFGVPVNIREHADEENVPSCPVLLKPKHTVREIPACSSDEMLQDRRGKIRLKQLKNFYHALKYTFTTPFVLVETMGPGFGVWLSLKTLAPSWAARIKQAVKSWVRPPIKTNMCLKDIGFEDQCHYAENALRMFGLIDHFAPLVILCGHGSSTHNNAYATALDCGACGGRHGGVNAQILAAILNQTMVRQVLQKNGISIPDKTHFAAAEHNTTTDAVTLYQTEGAEDLTGQFQKLEQAFKTAQQLNAHWRCQEMGQEVSLEQAHRVVAVKSANWAETRPEWGLARNAAFIVGPRRWSQNINLEGRAFLHSYEWEQDLEGQYLEGILTAPMVVAQWINSQYLFSTLDNVAYGSGSKITQNITGKIGVMQGNGSDLMTGLPLQSVYLNDSVRYHQPLRLMTVVYAPPILIEPIIKRQPLLQKLFGQGWLTLAVVEPNTQHTYFLERDLNWKKLE